MAKQSAQRTDDTDVSETQEQLAARQAEALDKLPAPARAAAEAQKVEASNRVLQSNRMRASEGSHNSWDVDVDHGVTQADLERTSFWQHHTKMCRVKDHVHAYCVDGSWYAHMLVLAVGSRDVKTKVLALYDLDPIEPGTLEIPSGYRIEWRGNIAKFGVLRGNEVIKEGFDQRSGATQWLGNHLQALAR